MPSPLPHGRLDMEFNAAVTLEIHCPQARFQGNSLCDPGLQNEVPMDAVRADPDRDTEIAALLRIRAELFSNFKGRASGGLIWALACGR